MIEALEGLVEPVARGDPMSPLRWTSKSTRKLASGLKQHGFDISPRTVATLLKEPDYSLQAPRKTKKAERNLTETRSPSS